MRRLCLLAFIITYASIVLTVQAQDVLPLKAGEDFISSITDDHGLLSDTTLVDTVIVDNLLWPQSLQHHVATLIENCGLLQQSVIGIQVFDLTADSVLYSLDARKTLRPASTMKVLTAIAALDRLGSEYQYTTYLQSTGYVDDSTHVLFGDLYITGSMDPLFSRDDLERFADAIVSKGIQSIRGNIYEDRSIKDDNLLGWGWCWDDDNPILSPLVYERKDKMLEQFASLLKERNVAIEGTLASRPCRGDFTEVSICTHSIDQILYPMMKKSDNLFAESLFYHIALSQGKPATATKARNVEKALISRLGHNPSDYVIADGSGLSLYNHLSPELEVALLRYAFSKPEIFEALYASLPIAGNDGTLSKRMRGTPAANVVRAKTGTVRAVSSLAGYAQASNGHMLAFSIINQGTLNSTESRILQNRICAELCR